MGFTAAVIGIGAGALAAGSSIAGGIADRNVARAEAKQYEENARQAKIGADQAEVLRREDLLGTLSSIRAIRTSRGLDPTSPTGLAINERVRMQGERAIQAERLNSLNEQGKLYSAAAVSRAKGKTSLIQGFLKAGMYGLNAYGTITKPPPA